MTRERWKEVQQMIHEQFSVEYEGVEELDGIPGQADVIEFEGPLGYMRVEFVEKPRQIGRVVHTSARIGGASNEEIRYSNSETTAHLSVFVWNDVNEQWKEMDKKMFE